jgi:hypothetical protein
VAYQSVMARKFIFDATNDGFLIIWLNSMEQEKIIQGSPHKLQDFFFQVVVKFQDDQTVLDLGEDVDFDLLDDIIPCNQFRN